MPEYVRVRDKETGHHVSILRSQFEAEAEFWQELKQDATDAGGAPLPPKYKTTVSAEAGKKADQSAVGSEKES